MALFSDRLVIPPAQSVNAAASMRSLPLVANGAVVPLVYGTVRTQPMVLNIIKHATDATLFLVQVLWARGACQAISNLKINNATELISASTHYLDGGTVNAALSAAFTAQGITYGDTLTGFCNSTLTLLTARFTGEMKIEGDLQAKKVYDPRKDTTNGGSGSHRLATPSTWEYSDNASLCLADFLYSSVYGAGVAVDWSTVITAANANDALVGSPSEKHRTLNVIFGAQASTADVAEALRAYAGVWLLPGSNGVKLVPDTTRASDATYLHASGQIAAMGDLQKKDISNVPTVVEVVYTNTDANAPNSPTLSVEVAVAGAGSTKPWRKSVVQLPGINRYSQAKREATERLNKLNAADLYTTMEVFDIGARHEIGDVITVTHPVGITSKQFRINDIQRADHGRWLLGLAEYQPSAYDTTVATTPTYADYGTTIGATVNGIASEIRDANGNLILGANGATPTGFAGGTLAFSETFETTTLEGWTNHNGDGELSIVSVSDGFAGGKVLRIGNNSGNDQAWLVHNVNIAFDPGATYRVRCVARQTAGGGVAYAGVAGVAGDGTTYVNISGANSAGSQHYIAAANVALGSGWTEYIGYISGSAPTGTSAACPDPVMPGQMHQNVRYIRPLFLAHYNAAAGQTELASFTIERIDGFVGRNLFWPAQLFSVPGGGPENYGRLIGLTPTATGYFRNANIDLGGYGFQPGEVVTLSADIYCDAATSTAGQYVSLFFFTADNTGAWKAVAEIYTTSSSPIRKSSTVTLPVIANMYHIGIGLYHQGTNASTTPTGTIYADKIQVERGPRATPYAPATALGSINTDQIASGAATSVVGYFDSSRTFLRTSSTPFTDAVVGNTYTNNTGGQVTVEIHVTTMLGAGCNTAGRTFSANFYLTLSTDQTGVPAFPGAGPTISGSGVFASGGQFATTFTMTLDNGKYVTPVMNAYQTPGGGSANVSVAYSDLSMRVTAIKR